MEIQDNPEFLEIPFRSGKARKYTWLLTRKNAYFAFRVLTNGPYDFDTSNWDYNRHLENLKVSVIGSVKVAKGEITESKIVEFQGIKPVAYFVAKLKIGDLPCTQIDYAFDHRNKYFQVGVRFPEGFEAEGIKHFKWFVSQIKLF